MRIGGAIKYGYMQYIYIYKDIYKVPLVTSEIDYTMSIGKVGFQMAVIKATGYFLIITVFRPTYQE